MNGLFAVLRSVLVEYGEIPEWNIGNHEVGVAIAYPLRFFKAGHLDIRIRIEFLKNTACHRVQFDADEIRTSSQRLRHEAKKKPGSGRGFDDPPASETELFHHAPHGLNNVAGGIEGIQRRVFGCIPFLFGQ